jgi:hypothetical protein
LWRCLAIAFSRFLDHRNGLVIRRTQAIRLATIVVISVTLMGSATDVRGMPIYEDRFATTSPSRPEPEPRRIRAGRYAIGDSVMLGAVGGLGSRRFRVNAKVSRQFSTGVELVAELLRTRRLPRDLVFHLGTNGTAPARDCRKLVNMIGPQRIVWLVTVKVARSWRQPNNRVLRACARRSERARLIPWNAHAHGHPGWFAPDGYHLTSAGRSAYASFIDSYV